MKKRILVVGSGVIGLSTAHFAAQRDHEVTVIDRRSEDHEGCSYGNAGMVVPSHVVPLAAPGMVGLALRCLWNRESPFWIRPRLSLDLLSWGVRFLRAANKEHVERSAPLLRDLHLGSRALFEELAAIPGNDFGLVKKGLLMLCRSEEALAEEAHMAEKARRLGIPAEVLTPEAAAKLDPGARMTIRGAVHFPKDCHLSPSRFMLGLRRQLELRGARFVWDTEVLGWRIAKSSHGARRIEAVETGRGGFTADEYVLAGGAWSAGIARQLGLRLPMQAGKGYSLTLKEPRRSPEICSILVEARVAVTPLGGALRFGGTMEIAGLDESINPARVRGIVKAVPRFYPEFSIEDFEGIRPWCGLRPCSPDGLPYVGRARRFQNVSVAAGHAMLGLSLGPITGKLMAEVLSDERPSIDIALLDPDRYA